ncbi:hypothetical protein [Rhizorhabdus sp.]|jgi:hypothetical protein|uniref:hypothetical protein n=1 Tax=Rhizorhabdus sp. TaxID=1968843 RepID=UPI0019A6AF00|nr:hypothetical protein [Rhizorhabdus sp.]MBD3761471.1 hypothetical protein [Rhizorhabdus sp.]
MNPYPITSEPAALGKGYSVAFTFDGARLDSQWLPRMPYGRRGRSLLPAYRAARDAFLGKVARYTGQNIAVIDLPAEGVRS